jgi:hypothetical protein
MAYSSEIHRSSASTATKRSFQCADGCCLTRSGEGIGVAAVVEVIGDGLQEYPVADTKAAQAVCLEQGAGYQQVRTATVVLPTPP